MIDDRIGMESFMDACEVDKLVGEGSTLVAQLMAAAREGHLCIEGGEEDCAVEVLKGNEERFDKKVGRFGNRYYLQRNWVLEGEVVRGFQRLLQGNVKPIDLGTSEGLNRAQEEAVRKGLCENVLCLTGGPGTGKTYTVAQIVKRFKGKGCVCAPTGKAVSLLREKLDVEVGTLHRMLGVKSGKDLLFGSGELDCEMVIVDECSMIDVGMWARLLRSLKTGTRVILVGDHDQLPPVEAGTVFGELCRYMKERGEGYIHLEECMRSDQAEILEMAAKVRRGEMVEYEELGADVEKWWDRGYQILSCLRRGRYGVDALNKMMEKRKDTQRPIIVTRSNQRMGVNNGEMGFLKGEEITIGERRLRASLLSDYEWAYCLSVHKSQGSEFDKVALLVPKGAEAFGREILYTGITRAKEGVVVLSEEGVIEECLKQTSEKMSGMKERLRQCAV